MTLWDLLTVITFVIPIGASIATAHHVHAGFWGYAIAVSLSLMVGIACGWALRASASRVATIVGDHPGTFGQRLCVGTYFCACLLWPFVSGFLGGWATSSAFELFRFAAK